MDLEQLSLRDFTDFQERTGYPCVAGKDVLERLGGRLLYTDKFSQGGVNARVEQMQFFEKRSDFPLRLFVWKRIVRDGETEPDFVIHFEVEGNGLPKHYGVVDFHVLRGDDYLPVSYQTLRVEGFTPMQGDQENSSVENTYMVLQKGSKFLIMKKFQEKTYYPHRLLIDGQDMGEREIIGKDLSELISMLEPKVDSSGLKVA